MYTKNGIEKIYYKLKPNIPKIFFCNTMFEIRNRIRHLAKLRDIEYDFQYYINCSFEELNIRTDNINIRELEDLYVKEELKISYIFPDVMDFLENAKKKKFLSQLPIISHSISKYVTRKINIEKYFKYIFIFRYWFKKA